MRADRRCQLIDEQLARFLRALQRRDQRAHQIGKHRVDRRGFRLQHCDAGKIGLLGNLSQRRRGNLKQEHVKCPDEIGPVGFGEIADVERIFFKRVGGRMMFVEDPACVTRKRRYADGKTTIAGRRYDLLDPVLIRALAEKRDIRPLERLILVEFVERASETVGFLAGRIFRPANGFTEQGAVLSLSTVYG